MQSPNVVTQSTSEIPSDKEFISTRNRILSTYYPDEFNTVHDCQVDIVLQCPFDEECGKMCSFDSDGMFECNSCGKSGILYDNYFELIEGISREDARSHINALLGMSDAAKNIPSMADVNLWHDDLLLGRCPFVKDYLNNDRGLTDDTLIEYLIGYDKKKDEIVIPVMNATGKGFVGVKYKKFKNGNCTGVQRQVGNVRLWGYHELKRTPEKSQVIIVDDELDAIILHQHGYAAVVPMLSADKWADDFGKLFYERSVVVCYNDSQRSIPIITSVLGFASTTQSINYGNGLCSVRLNAVSDYFTKANGTNPEFDKTLKQISSIPKSLKSNIDKIQSLIDQQKKVLQLNPAQDYVEGKMVYGTVYDNKPSIIRSDREVISIDDIKQQNLYHLAHEQFKEARFSLVGMQHFILQTKNASPHSLYEKIKAYIKKFVFIKDEDVYTILTLWTMGTYVHRVFAHYPYVHISSEKNSGKSNLMSVMKEIAFNGDMSVESTAAVLLRKVHRSSPTLFLDEVEHLRKRSGGTFRTLLSILNSGYSVTGVVSRSQGSDIISYNTYSPKMFAGIEDVGDTLSDRSIKIRTLRKLPDEHADKYGRGAEILAEDIRDELYTFGLTHALNISKKYEKLDSLPYMNGIENRRADLWAPILILADIIGAADVMDAAKRYMVEDEYLHTINDADDSSMVNLIHTLSDLLKDESPVRRIGHVYRFKNDAVLRYFQMKSEFKDIKSANALTRLLGKIGIKSKTQNIGKGDEQRCYDVDQKLVLDLEKRYSSQKV